MNTISALSPIISNFLQSTGLRSLSNPASPVSPTPTTDTTPTTTVADENTADADMMQADAGAESDTTVVAAGVETPEDKRRRKRREKDARQKGARLRRSNSGAGGGGGAGPAPTPAAPTPAAGGDGSGAAAAAATAATDADTGDAADAANTGDDAAASDADDYAAASDAVAESEEEEVVDEDVSLGAPAVPGSGDVATVKDDDDRSVESQVEPDAPLPGSGDVAEAEGDDSTSESQGEPDGEAGGDQIRIERVESDDDDGDKKSRVAVTVREVEEGEEDRHNDLEEENTTEAQRVVDITTSDVEPASNEQDLTHPEPQPINSTSGIEPERNEQDPTRPESQLTDPTNPVEPERDERPPSYGDSQLPDLTPNIIKPKRTAKDPRRSPYRIATLRINKSPPQTTIPTIKQLYPKPGLGPTIEIPSKSEHRFIIDTLESPNTTPTQQKQRALQLQPSLKFPESLTNLQPADLTDPLRAEYMSATAHSVLADRLWRIVKSANYFSPDQKLAINTDLPPGLQCMNPRQPRLDVPVQGSKLKSAKRPLPSPAHRLVVENAVLWFLERTRNDSDEYFAVMNEFTWANRAMALRLHDALVKKRVVRRKELYGMFVEGYGGGMDGVECVVDMEGLGFLFDGRRDG